MNELVNGVYMDNNGHSYGSAGMRRLVVIDGINKSDEYAEHTSTHRLYESDEVSNLCLNAIEELANSCHAAQYMTTEPVDLGTLSQTELAAPCGDVFVPLTEFADVAYELVSAVERYTYLSNYFDNSGNMFTATLADGSIVDEFTPTGHPASVSLFWVSDSVPFSDDSQYNEYALPMHGLSDYYFRLILDRAIRRQSNMFDKHTTKTAERTPVYAYAGAPLSLSDAADILVSYCYSRECVPHVLDDDMLGVLDFVLSRVPTYNEIDGADLSILYEDYVDYTTTAETHGPEYSPRPISRDNFDDIMFALYPCTLPNFNYELIDADDLDSIDLISLYVPTIDDLYDTYYENHLDDPVWRYGDGAYGTGHTNAAHFYDTEIVPYPCNHERLSIPNLTPSDDD